MIIDIDNANLENGNDIVIDKTFQYFDRLDKKEKKKNSNETKD